MDDKIHISFPRISRLAHGYGRTYKSESEAVLTSMPSVSGVEIGNSLRHCAAVERIAVALERIADAMDPKIKEQDQKRSVAKDLRAEFVDAAVLLHDKVSAAFPWWHTIPGGLMRRAYGDMVRLMRTDSFSSSKPTRIGLSQFKLWAERFDPASIDWSMVRIGPKSTKKFHELLAAALITHPPASSEPSQAAGPGPVHSSSLPASDPSLQGSSGSEPSSPDPSAVPAAPSAPPQAPAVQPAPD